MSPINTCKEGSSLQTLFKNRLVFLMLIVVTVLCMILSAYNLSLAVKEQLSPISSNIWTLSVKDISNSVISLNKNHPVFTVFFQWIRLLFSKLSLFSHLDVRPDVLLRYVSTIHFQITLLFFTIFYQLARTSSENSAPYILNRHLRSPFKYRRVHHVIYRRSHGIAMPWLCGLYHLLFSLIK